MRPVSATWDELVRVQESLGEAYLGETERALLMPEPALIDIAPGKQARTSSALGSAPGTAELGCSGLLVEPPLGVDFEAQADEPTGLGSVFIPPNTAGSVGPEYTMVMLNNKVHVQDRLGGSVLSLDTLVFWSPLAAPSVAYCRVYYDLVSSRWLTTARGGSGATSTVMFAISAGSDPTGAWTYYSTPGDPGATTFPDWLTMGYDQTWVAVAANMFNATTGVGSGTRLYTFDLGAALLGGPITISTFASNFWAVGTGAGAATSGFSLHPARSLDSSVSGLWLFNNAFTSGSVNNLIQMASITGTGPAPVFTPTPGSPFGGNTSLIFVATNYSNTQLAMPQVGDARFITSFSTRLASVVARNGKLWLAHSCGLPGPANNAAPTSNGISWYQLDPVLFPTPIVQSGQITDGPGTVASYPSLAVNCGDDAIIGFSRGNAAVNPECAYTVRLGSDPLGAMGPTRLLKAGESSYWKNFGVGTTAQWGLYSSSSVDPLDDRTLWTLQEYAAQRVGPADNDSRWGTRWGRVGSCGTPTITDDPDSIAVCLGDQAMFSVSATAFAGPLDYQWRKDGVDIPGANLDTFTIVSTVALDVGNYDVVVIDGCGTATSLPATLSFNGAVVNDHPVDAEVQLGDSASFTVNASGTGVLTYQWRKNGAPIAGANAATYSIPSVKRSDLGLYDVVVADDCGPTESNTAQLRFESGAGNATTFDLALSIQHQPESTQVCEGSLAVLEVVATPASATFSWRKGGVPLVPAQTGSTLIIGAAALGDAGTYDVVVTSGGKSQVSEPAVIAVDALPVVLSSPSNQAVALGASASFTVVADGAPELTYQWQKRNQPFQPFANVPGATSATLTINNVGNGNSGQYRCIVSNHCGTAVSGSANLSILF